MQLFNYCKITLNTISTTLIHQHLSHVNNLRSFFIAGTDTHVGKTYITCLLLRQWRQAGLAVAGMKPVASGMESINGYLANADIEAIMRATDYQYPVQLVNQYCYHDPIAPHIAAAKQNKQHSLVHIVRAFSKLATITDGVLVEGAGGLLTPLDNERSFLALPEHMSLPVILVVAVRLGCINHALLSQAALHHADIEFAGWVANYAGPNEPEQPAIVDSLQHRLSAPLLGVVAWQMSDSPSCILDTKPLMQSDTKQSTMQSSPGSS